MRTCTVLMLSVRRGLRYKWNTDKDVTVLKFTDLDGDGIGMLRLKKNRSSNTVAHLL